MKLQDTVAIVTGAGSGIGLAITQRFLAEGARVVAGDIAEAHLATLRELRGCCTAYSRRGRSAWTRLKQRRAQPRSRSA